MRWSSVTGAAVHTIAESVRMRRPSEIARSDANLTQVTGVAGEERPADSRGSRRHRSLSATGGLAVERPELDFERLPIRVDVNHRADAAHFETFSRYGLQSERFDRAP